MRRETPWNVINGNTQPDTELQLEPTQGAHVGHKGKLPVTLSSFLEKSKTVHASFSLPNTDCWGLCM